MNNNVDLLKLKNTYPFDILTDSEFDSITADTKTLFFKKNEFLFHENEEEIELYFLINGLAKNILHKANGEQFSVRYYNPGDLIGLMIMLAGGQMSFSVQALQNCEVVLLKKSAFLQIMGENKLFSEIVLEGIGERMKSLYNEITRERNEAEHENISLFRTRVDAIMGKAMYISPTATIIQAAKRLREEVGDGLVVVDSEQNFVGTITQRDLLHVIISNDLSKKVSDVMNKRPLQAQYDSFCYDILSYFKDDHIDFIPVVKYGKAIGVLTAESFLQLQDSNYISLSHSVHHAQTIDQLQKFAAVRNTLFIDFVEELLTENTFAYDVCELISNYNDKIHRQVIRLVLKEMNLEGYGNPPINYCFIVMGSQGRREQAFSTDQDNGLILDNFQHLPNKKEIEYFFQVFAEKVNQGLEACGFPLCSGNVMAKEKKWRRSFDEWVLEIERWVKETDAEEIRDFTIFIDYRPIFGDFTLASRLRDQTTEIISNGKILHLLLMKDTIRFRVPLNPFGMIITTGKEKTINLKKAAIMQIVNGIRIFSIQHEIKKESTIYRLNSLADKDAIHSKDVQNLKHALHHLLFYRLKNNINQLRTGQPLTNELALEKVSKEDKKELKEALSIAKRMQQMCELSFGRKRGL